MSRQSRSCFVDQNRNINNLDIIEEENHLDLADIEHLENIELPNFELDDNIPNLQVNQDQIMAFNFNNVNRLCVDAIPTFNGDQSTLGIFISACEKFLTTFAIENNPNQNE